MPQAELNDHRTFHVKQSTTHHSRMPGTIDGDVLSEALGPVCTNATVSCGQWLRLGLRSLLFEANPGRLEGTVEKERLRERGGFGFPASEGGFPASTW